MPDDWTDASRRYENRMAVDSPVERWVGRLVPERASACAPNFQRGDLVRKRSGSAWEGIVVGEYSTSLTPEGYAVESLYHPGSVQIYPVAALELVARSKTPNRT